MLMKKRLIVGVLFCVLFVIALACGYFIFNNSNDKIVLKNEKIPSKMHTTNALTMMYETEAGSGEYIVSSDNVWLTDGYVFNETLSKCENGSILTWDDENKKVLMQANKSDKCYVYFDKAITFTEYITTQVYTGTDGENGLYYHDGIGTYSNADQEAGDNSYRYSGANPNNFVCFGSDAASCPVDNLYRIIGVFNGQVKLIKYDYADPTMLGTDGSYTSNIYNNTSSSYYKGSMTTINRYYWNNSEDFYWENSTLATVNLNSNYVEYLNNINEKWINMVEVHEWNVGDITSSIIMSNTKNAYYYESRVGEISSESNIYNYDAKIGLMYVSDYGYAASPENWSTELGGYNSDTNRNNNWLFMGLYEWTIIRCSENWYSAYIISDNGLITNYGINSNDLAVRPTFYLESSIELSGGSGTQTDPYRIA